MKTAQITVWAWGNRSMETMKTNSIGINKWAGSLSITKSWQCGEGDNRIIGWTRADGARGIETNGDPYFENEDGFDKVWAEASQPATAHPMTRLRTYRTSLGLSQSDLAAQMRVPVKTLQNWEQGRTPVPGLVDAWLDLAEIRLGLAEVSGKQDKPALTS